LFTHLSNLSVGKGESSATRPTHAQTKCEPTP
jgi:hypothetical protein